jgi:hypothetical protein
MGERVQSHRHGSGLCELDVFLEMGCGYDPYLDMLLQVLRTLERLAAELTLVRLERNMNTDVRGDVVSLDRSSSARVPLASQVEVVCALAANMALTNMLL